MSAAAPILLDITRLLARAGRRAPTGIDRVEHAYAEYLLRLAPERLHFVAIDALDGLNMLPAEAARRFIALIGQQWRGAVAGEPAWKMAQLVWGRALFRAPPIPRHGARPIYLLVSHRHLHRPARVAAALRATDARLVVFVHDLIPIDYPEYARPGHDAVHRRRIATVAAQADGVIVNSADTARILQPHLRDAARAPPVLVAPLGVGLPRSPAWPASMGEDGAPKKPYFVCLGTIEPRKNHMLLLHVWRRLVERHGPACPCLVLVGRRGWENENVIDLLDRSPAVRETVVERQEMTDQAIADLLAGARALLFPSFAEGYGLPLAEALAAGAPAVCSDIAAFREVGRAVPDYLDPLDGTGWLAAVEAYRDPDSPRRQAQLARLAGWRAPEWRSHLMDVLAFLDGLAAQDGRSSSLAISAPVRARASVPDRVRSGWAARLRSARLAAAAWEGGGIAARSTR